MTMNPPKGYRLLVLANCIGHMEQAPGKVFMDDCILEFDPQGKEVWRWEALEHISEMGLSEAAIQVIYESGTGDWCHLNAVSYIGQNRFYDEGDVVFDPENLIVSSRELSLLFIIRKTDGKIIWKMGPQESSTYINSGRNRRCTAGVCFAHGMNH